MDLGRNEENTDNCLSVICNDLLLHQIIRSLTTMCLSVCAFVSLLTPIFYLAQL